MSINQITYKQGQALARFIATLRPDWDTPGIENALGKAREMAPAADLAIAAIKAATSPSARTPAIIGMEGPHWRGAEHKPHKPFDPGHTCQTCSLPEHQCRSRWAEDHEFLSVERARAVRGTPLPERIRESLHAPPPEPATPTFADHAAPAVEADAVRVAAARGEEGAGDDGE